MSDLSEPGAAFLAASDGEGPEVDAPEVAPEPAPDATDPTPEVEPAGDEASASKEPVPYGLHKKVTEESARYRTQLREYEAAFEGWAPDDAKVLLQAVGVSARLVSEGKGTEAARIWREVAGVLGPEAAEAVQDAAVDAADDGADELMSKGEVERMLSERDQAREYESGVEREMRSIRQAADELGYDPESEDWAIVLSEAATFHEGDVRAAAGAVKAREQAAIDKYLAGKTNTARNTPRVADGSNPAPAGAEPVQTIGEASDRLRAFLDAQ